MPPRRGDSDSQTQEGSTPGARTDTFGKYRIVQLLGEGAMGEVYLGQDPDIHRPVAIKVMKARGSKDEQRFRHEARVVGGLSHPNIVVLHEFGFHEERPYLVMEYLGGMSLEAWLREPHLLSEHLRVLDGLAAALNYAHAEGVLHRDLKPSNVQVMPNGTCKLMDFGIARLPSAGITGTDNLIGTPAYMAPEVLEDAAYSARADVYSAGVLSYEMLSGSNPFLGRSVAATLRNVLEVDPRPLSLVRPDLPPELSEAVMACLARDPEARPADLRHLHAVVSRLLTGHSTVVIPAAAQPQPTLSLMDLPTTRKRRRRRRVRAAAVMAAVLAGAALAIAIWLSRVEEQSPPISQATGVVPPSATAPAAPAVALPTEPPLVAPATTLPRAAPRSSPAPVPTPRQGVAVSPRVAATPSALPGAAVAPPATTPPVPAATLPPPAPRSVSAPPVTAAPDAVLTSLAPRTARRRATVVVEVRGTGLRPDLRARVLRGLQEASGLHVVRQEPLRPNGLRITLLVDEDAPLGLYSIVLADAEGRLTNSLPLEVVL
jgi:serine/threonine-protein kinase